MRAISLKSATRTTLPVIAFLAILVATQASAEPYPQGDPEKGEKTFSAKGCASCHSVGGKGSSDGIDLVLSDVDFGSYDFAARIWNHAGLMGDLFKKEIIAWPTFRDDEMRALIHYLRAEASEQREKHSTSGKATKAASPP